MLSITQSPPKAWQAHLKSACSTLGSDVRGLFANALAWAVENDHTVPDGDHYAEYLASLEETPPNPAIPAYVRRYVNDVLCLFADDDGSDAVQTVTKAPQCPVATLDVPSAAEINAVRNLPPRYMHRQSGRH